jgi:hypothetical protein
VAAGKDYNARGRGRRRGAGTLKLYQGKKKTFGSFKREVDLTRADNEDMTLSLLTWFFFLLLSSFPPLPTNISQEQQTAFRLKKPFPNCLFLPSPLQKRGKDKPLALFNLKTFPTCSFF